MIETEKIKNDQINDNCLHMRFDSHNHVTTRRNGQQSVQFEIMIFLMNRRLLFVAKAIFVVNFQQSEKTRKRNKKIEKRWVNDFFSSNYRNSESKFVEGLNKWLLCRKTRLKNWIRKIGETRKEIEQEQCYKKGMNKWRSVFHKKGDSNNVLQKKKEYTQTEDT